LERQGISVNREEWRKRNFNYLWPSRLLSVVQIINDTIPRNATYLLINDEEWDSTVLTSPKGVAFPQRDGIYWGPPENGAAAISELELAMQAGATFLVIWWTCFWWLDHYDGFSSYLRQKFRCVHEDQGAVIYDLSAPEKCE